MYMNRSKAYRLLAIPLTYLVSSCCYCCSSCPLGSLIPCRYVATGAIGLVALVAFMVLSFWLIPGLDACPDTLYDERSAVVTTMETSATMTLAAITTDPPGAYENKFIQNVD